MRFLLALEYNVPSQSKILSLRLISLFFLFVHSFDNHCFVIGQCPTPPSGQGQTRTRLWFDDLDNVDSPFEEEEEDHDGTLKAWEAVELFIK